ncbi:hypothetical protein EGW08_017730 [Elysia chlorotica]|uniref:SRCR domain-containing protein n=1 Tax=Elysia chlorotica TaxID=188477 RepID=A0A3S1AX49_ELYCH|nr:hypothetical protein EGW08_017730 [Elysia chlorotica]
MHRQASLLVLSVLCAVASVRGYTSIWTIRHASHPYKTELYTAEFVKGGWRYLWCADHIRLEDAVVLCNQMAEFNGLGPYDVSTSRLEFGSLHKDPAEQDAFTNETFACVGTESSLRDCPMVAVSDSERCPSGNVGQVDCKPADNARKNLRTSLLSQPDLTEMGVVKVENSSLGGVAGLVCDEDGLWGQNEAHVVCRSLGYEMGFPVEIASSPQAFVIKNVKCQGTETSINDCPHTDMCQSLDYQWRTFSCPHQCDGVTAAVICG